MLWFYGFGYFREEGGVGFFNLFSHMDNRKFQTDTKQPFMLVLSKNKCWKNW